MTSGSLMPEPRQTDRASTKRVRPRERLLDVDRTKAIAIIFVVLGHISDPQGPLWSGLVRVFIYAFHMPLFMYLSGFVFVYTSTHLMKRGFLTLVLSRANRLLVPFFVMATFVITLKLVGGRFTDFNRPAVDLLAAYQTILINTQQSPALDLWYLFVLFVFSVATPLLFRLSGGRFWPLLALSLVMYGLFIQTTADNLVTDDFYASRMCWFYVFFIAGCMTATRAELWLTWIAKTWPITLALFVICDLYMMFYWPFNPEWKYLPVGLLSAAGIHGLMRSRWVRGDKLLLVIADSTLAIYLFNTIFIGVARAVFVRFADPADNMAMFYLVCAPVGLAGPMLLRWIVARLSFTRPLLIYIS